MPTVPEYFTKEQAERARAAFQAILDDLKYNVRYLHVRDITTVHIFIEEAKRHAPAEEKPASQSG